MIFAPSAALLSLPPVDHLLLFLPAMLLCIAAPGPDMMLSIARGLGQGPWAAAISSFGTGCGIAFHSLLVGFGLTALLQASTLAFGVLKLAGAAYLIWLGIQAIRSNGLIVLESQRRRPLPRVFVDGVAANVLNPKVAVFVLAFLPQFVDSSATAVRGQILGLGAIFAVSAVLIYSAMGATAATIRSGLLRRPRWVRGLNCGAGSVLIASGLAVLAVGRR